MIPKGTVAIIILVISSHLCSTGRTKPHLEMQRVEQINGTDIIKNVDVRIKKYNRTVAVVDGTTRLLKDLGDDYEFRLTVAHSPLGNNQFNEYPMKIPQTKGCEAINGRYREYQHFWANDTNLPMVTDAGLCPFPKGEYWARNWEPSSDWIPSVAPEGYWRMTFDIINANGVVECQIRAYGRMTRALV